MNGCREGGPTDIFESARESVEMVGAQRRQGTSGGALFLFDEDML